MLLIGLSYLFLYERVRPDVAAGFSDFVEIFGGTLWFFL